MADLIKENSPIFTDAERLIIWANSCVGSPYLPHSVGVACTPTNRYKASVTYPRACKYANSVCPVISRKVSDCHGIYDEVKRCRWYDHNSDSPLPAYGPLELVTQAMSIVGVKISTCGTTVEEFLGDKIIVYRGGIHNLSVNPKIACLVFNVSEETGNVSKIGIYNGADIPESVVYVKSYLSGVIKTDFDRNDWSHFALIDGLYSKDTYDNMLKDIIMAQNRSGEHVYPAKVATIGDGVMLNIRRRPSINSGIISQVPNGSEVQVLSRLDEMWLKVMYGDTIGYSVSKYIISN